MTTSDRIWAIVPAAGVGRRMQAESPKQYLSLSGLPVLQVTLNKLAQVNGLAGMVVAIASDDLTFNQQISPPDNTVVVFGGQERADSVLHALRYVEEQGGGADWALVHDAARPCVRPERIRQLIEQVLRTRQGGLLAVPVADTLKHAPQKQVHHTVSRNHLWQAHTPQMFPVGALRIALEDALAKGLAVTDEASALEHQGQAPQLVADSRDNIKITRPEDLLLAQHILAAQQASAYLETPSL